MRIIKVVLLDDESTEVVPEKVYMGEHRAARLEVQLPQRLKEGFDYYTLCFDVMGTGKRVPLGNIYESDAQEEGETGIAWMQNGKIFCELPDSLTQCSFFRAQVEACCEAEGICTRLEKSAPFIVAFADSIAGGGDTLSVIALEHTTRLMAELNKLRRTLRMKITDAQELVAPSILRAEQAADRAQQTADELVTTIEQIVERMNVYALIADLREELNSQWETETKAIKGGMPYQRITVNAGNSTLTLKSGIYYHLTVKPGATPLTLVLDNDDSTNFYIQKFMFLMEPLPADISVVLRYKSNSQLLLPENFSWNTGKVIETTVVDGHAHMAQWVLA